MVIARQYNLGISSLQGQSDATMARNQYDADLDLVPENSSKSYKMGTLTDQRDMRRVGKTQELRVS